MRLDRLRNAEWLSALGAIVLLVSLLALRWYAAVRVPARLAVARVPRRIYTYAGHPAIIGARSGWSALPTLRWFLLVTVALGLALALTQATNRGPALPSTLDLLAMLVGGLSSMLLLIRLATTGAPLRVGAVVGMLACVAVTGGAFRALRTEQGWRPTPGRDVELVELPTGGASA